MGYSFNSIQELLRIEEQERREKQAFLMKELTAAVQAGDWDMVSSLVVNPDIMGAGLAYAYPYLPDEYKFSIPTDCYTHFGDHLPVVRKYVRQAGKYAPVEKRIPAEMASMPEIIVYRAGQEPMDKARFRISWTDKLEKAQWFYDRALSFGAPECHLYQGVIQPEKIIWYTDARHESEVMQYNSVRDIIELER